VYFVHRDKEVRGVFVRFRAPCADSHPDEMLTAACDFFRDGYFISK
jgi:hypothetical protein